MAQHNRSEHLMPAQLFSAVVVEAARSYLTLLFPKFRRLHLTFTTSEDGYGEVSSKKYHRNRTSRYAYRFEAFTTVSDAVSSHPLAGTSVMAVSHGRVIGTFTSDQAGRLAIWIEGDHPRYAIPFIQLVAVKPGYETQRIPLANLQNDLGGIRMTRSVEALAAP